MLKKITFLTNIIVFFLYTVEITKADSLIIYPPKKPALEEKIKQKKISEDIIKPQKKPYEKKVITINSKEKNNVIEKKAIFPKVKPKLDKKIIKANKIDGIIVPKNKPLIAKKEANVIKKKIKVLQKKRF